MTVAERIQASGPKKTLALDGGGIRGMITVEILAAVEELLRSAQPEANRASFILADYFDKEQDLLYPVFGKCLAGDQLDRGVGNLQNAKGPTASKLFTYMRYNADVTHAGLSELGLP